MNDKMSTAGAFEGIVFVALTATGAALAGRLAADFPATEVHGRAGRTSGAQVEFTDTAAHLRKLFEAGRTIVGVCAAGILIRALSGVIGDKSSDPPVVALSEDGSFAVPLLGGHIGANRLATEIAARTDGHAAVTTAGEVAFGIALDDPPPGWRVADRSKAKPVMAALLAGEPVRLEVEGGDAGWLTTSGAPFGDTGEACVRVSDRPARGDAFTLHPPVLALGVGCARGTSAGEVVALAERTLADAGLAAEAVACVCSLDLKADEAAVHALAEHLRVPVRFFAADVLERETPRLANPSDVVFAEVGCHGVAEAAALAAAGPGGELAAEKHKTENTTCAIARATAAIDPGRVGRPQGKLTVVGIGPGRDDWRTSAVTRALAGATDIVGYSLYLDLLGSLIDGKQRHQSDLAQEEARVRRALDLAAEGRDVALVSSGDAGIYALAALVFELLDREDRGDWNRVRLSVEPGVSAIQAAAARIGAPIGHDFCTVSLSDLLTPWEEIERRLGGAALGDFIVALYNPVSKRRREQLVRARDILLGERPAETPVVLARNLGRDGETLDVITLGGLEPDRVDMLTLVLIGNRQTRAISRGENRWVYTPRGYGKKLGESGAYVSPEEVEPARKSLP